MTDAECKNARLEKIPKFLQRIKTRQESEIRPDLLAELSELDKMVLAKALEAT